MKAILKSSDIKRLVKSTAKFISKDNNRELMQYIRLDFDKETCSVKAVALDGYKLSVENSNCLSVDESFSVYVKPYLPIGIKSDYTSVEIVGDNCLIEMNGRITGFKQPIGSKFDDVKVLLDLEKTPVILTVYVNGTYLLDALKSMCKEDVTRSQPLMLEFRSSIAPFLIKNKNGFKLISPVRNKS